MASGDSALNTTGIFTTVSTLASTEEPGGGPMSPMSVARTAVCVIGVLGNLIVILLILIPMEFRKGTTAWYIMHLALADMIFLLTLPFKIIEAERNSWDFPVGLCRLNQSILFINYYCSISFLTIMAIDRYIAICHSFSERLQKFRTQKAAYITTGIVWIVAILICIPIMLFSDVRGTQPNCLCQMNFPTYEEKVDFNDEEALRQLCIKEKMDDDMDYCLDIMREIQQETKELNEDENAACQKMPDWSEEAEESTTPTNMTEGGISMGCHYFKHAPGFVGLLYFNFIVMFIIPFIIITFCYSMIIRHLIKTAFKGDSNSAKSKQASKDDWNRKKVVIMCATLVAVFTICWLPYHGVHMAKMKGIPGTTAYCLQLGTITSLLIYINSAVNPFVYFIVVRFKSNLKRIRESSAGIALAGIFSRQTETGSLPSSSSGNKSGNQQVHESHNV